ncbi:MAG: hypothetical protein CMJ94_07115 [Planctomycetes bacterium]|nr:hypothetical protein [Planctomycetota bacterium]
MTGVMKFRSGKRSLGSSVFHRLLTILGAVLLTLTFFLVLPIIQAINAPPEKDTMLREASAVDLPTPEAPPIEEEEPEEEEEIEEEELQQDEQLLSLDQLELALSGEISGGFGGGSFGQVKLPSLTGGSGADDAAFALGSLDQEARPRFKQGPSYNAAIRAKIQRGPATVWLAFIVDESGQVIMPRVVSSPDPAFNAAALAAIKKWRFDPARSNGKPVRQPMKLPMTFQKSS